MRTPRRTIGARKPAASKKHRRAGSKPGAPPASKKAAGKRLASKKVAGKMPASAKPRKRARGRTKGSARASTRGVVEMALATFAHEVRTPLTGILAISELLATSGLGDRERHWVETIKASAEHLAALATLFVDSAKSHGTGTRRGSATGRAKRANAKSAGGKGSGAELSLRRDFFDLHTLARAAADSLAGRAAAKGLTAQIDLADGLAVYVLGDSVRLRAALENLIDNAVKFTEHGSVALSATLLPDSNERMGVAFAIADSGIGLTMAEARRLFRPFSQANVTIARRFGGAGLGLASVRALARAMGGDVTVAARRGGGTVFTFTVRLDRASPEEFARHGGDRPSLHAAASRALRVLCVEDNPFGRVILNTILTELGHHAEFVGRGEMACDRLAAGDIDAVLMDIVLPGIDGIETIRRIRALPQPLNAIPVIGVSGRGEDEPAARAAGANAFLLKPASPRSVAAALADIVQRAPAAS